MSELSSSTSLSGQNSSSSHSNQQQMVYRRRVPLKIGDLVDSTKESQIKQTYQDAESIPLQSTDTTGKKLVQTLQNDTTGDTMMAARALRELKKSIAPEDETIFGRVTSHPFISNSINYMLEKTIHASSNYLSDPQRPSMNKRLSSSLLDSDTAEDGPSTPVKRPKLTSGGVLSRERNLPPPILPAVSTYNNGNDRLRAFVPTSASLRQQVTINSAISAQRSLQDLTELSVINLNIESRRRLEMLIHFLKLGNSQLSERIENLIKMVEGKRSNPKTNLSDSDTTSSDGSINESQSEGTQFLSDAAVQQLKGDIVSTVKKIVNVVSKVSANSLAEPARSKVREALLMLPSNWAAMLELEKQATNNDAGQDEEEFDSSDDNSDTNSVATNYEDSKETLGSEDGYIGSRRGSTSSCSSTTSSKAVRQSITQRLLANLFRFKGGVSSRSTATFKAKQWFRRKIRSQMTYDPNGKVLILAQESLDMINNIIKFCSESLDKAETWNSSKQLQQQKNLMNKLEDMEYISTKDEKISTIVVKATREHND